MTKTDEQKAKDSKEEASKRRKEDAGKPDSEIGFGGTWFSDMGEEDAEGVGAGK